ncbi:UDP binding domain-containing protein, partial [Kaarinaea lacus]
LTEVNALILVTEWKSFNNPDFDRMKQLMNEPVVFDGRNQYDPEQMRRMGFSYMTIGRDSAYE